VTSSVPRGTTIRSPSHRSPASLAIAALATSATILLAHLAFGLGVGPACVLGALVAPSHLVLLARRAPAPTDEVHERWRSASDALGHGLFEWDVLADRIEVSVAYLATLGYGAPLATDLAQRGAAALFELLHPDDLAPFKARVAEHFAGKIPGVVFDARVRAADGAWRYISHRCAIAVRDARGKPLRLLGVLVDVTQQHQARAELAALERTMDLAVEAGGVGLWDVDWVNQTYRYNSLLKAMYGLPDPVHSAALTAPDMPLPEWFSRVHPDDVARVRQELIDAVHRGLELRLEHRIVRPDGGVRHVRSVGRLLRDASGKLERFIGTSIDITEERALLDELERERERLELATKVADVGIWELDVGNGTASWDARMHVLFGLAPGAFTGDPAMWGALIHPDDVQAASAVSTKALTTGEPSQESYRIVRPDGAVRHMRTATSGFDISIGRPRRVLGVVWDVTEERALHDALEFQKERLAMALHAGEVGVWEHDYIRDESFWDTRTDALYRDALDYRQGVPPDTYGGKAADFTAALPEPARTDLKSAMSMAGRDNPVVSVELDLVTRAGERRTVRSYARAAWDDDGRLVRLMGLNWDITAEKRRSEELARARDEADRASRAKSEFLASMSHEIRTPMNGVLGMAELVLDTSLSREQREFVETIRTSANALLAVIDDILDLSKIEAGKLDIAPFDFVLRDGVAETLRPLRLRAAAKGLELTHAIAPAVPDRLHGDWGRVRQVLVNLVGNAVKFTTHGSVRVTIDLAPPRDDGRLALACVVSDTGIGIPADLHDHIFAPFAQADIGISRRFGGTGLGLAISAQLVAMLGGTITLTSRAGTGSTFTFTLPLERAAARPAAVAHVAAPPRAPTPQGSGGLSVLLAEDNVVNQRVAQLMLQRRGCEVHLVGDGRAAIDAATAGDFDVVLMDIQMPELDGVEATRLIRADEARTGRRVPIVAVTAHAMAAERDRCLASGFDDFLTKPLAPDALDAVLARLASARARSEGSLGSQ